LYVRRVFIMDDAEQFLPLYLRFIKGVVDSADLPLNVSRELLQHNSDVESMRAALTRRALDMLAKLAQDEPDKYQTFWSEFGAVLKEGLAEDPGNRDKLLPMMRFASTASEDDAENVTLADYVARMKPGQERLYFVVGESLAAARSHPAIELLRAKGVEVLLLGRRVDAWVMDQLTDFEGKRFKDATRGDLELGGLADAADTARTESALKESKALLKRVKDALGERVSEVRVSTRLKDSVACLVGDEHDISAPLRRALEAAGQRAPATKPVLELNVEHEIVKRLDAESDATAFADLALLLFEQASLAEGGQLADPGAFVQRLNRLLVRLTTT
ncbi:MAG TPA: molecular chaperone HtpG, partial [Steroidobacteraceae bacterium]|nr:molecular chaperone HtpG [Steroidobacteraceae bacterium]